MSEPAWSMYLKEVNHDYYQGAVKWFNVAKGHGFIEPEEDGGQDAFVHISALENAGIASLNDGQKVGYVLVAGRNGKEAAENVQLRD